VHERAEIAADADGIDDCESNLRRRQAGQQTKHRRLQHRERTRPALRRRFDQQIRTAGNARSAGK